MNNFSPSTDTSVGTKRFTAQEVQLAYTLIAVEYMKTIKGLNPNHQLVDKAVKLKALGFTNSKEVGDAITSEDYQLIMIHSKWGVEAEDNIKPL